MDVKLDSISSLFILCVYLAGLITGLVAGLFLTVKHYNTKLNQLWQRQLKTTATTINFNNRVKLLEKRISKLIASMRSLKKSKQNILECIQNEKININ